MKNLVLVFLSVLLSLSAAYAQTGTIRGVVIDDELNEPLIAVNVYLDGTTTGVYTDLDGSYTLKVEPGTYTLVFSYITYATQKIENVVVEEGATEVIDIRLAPETQAIKEVVIVERQNRTTASFVDNLKKKSAKTIDGISSQSFKKSGDGDAAAALSRVTGVGVQDGKYVFVRGLGDRYTKSVLNGMDIPGLDPERNTVQMDIFPSNLIDNIIIYKTFTPDLTGDFTGGMIDVELKDFPDEKSGSASVSLGYRPGRTFNSDFILYKGSSTDWMTFDNGSRDIPIARNLDIPSPQEDDPSLSGIVSAFGQEMAVRNQSNFLDQNYAIGYGNQFNGDKADIGYNVAFNYSNQYQYLEDAEYRTYRKNPETDINSLEIMRSIIGDIGSNDAAASALASGAIKFDKHKFTASVLHSRNATKSAAMMVQKKFTENDGEIHRQVLRYVERAITNIGLGGKHQLGKGNIEWQNSTSLSSIDDPDVRTTAMLLEDNGDFSFSVQDGAEISRIYRELSELNNTFKVDYTLPFKQWKNLSSNFKTGVYHTYKDREQFIQDYRFSPRMFENPSGDPNYFFQPENIWTLESDTGLVVTGGFTPERSYEATQNIAAAYAMTELPITSLLKATVGARAEYVVNTYTGTNAVGDEVYNGDVVLEQLDILPSIGLVYNLQENMNIRASATRTVARPSFREISIAQIFDKIQNNFFEGNIDLEPTNITNLDLRWEYFFNRGELISVSAFYKNFQNPIELAAFPLSPSNFQPRNAEFANLAGLELEARKNFEFLNENLKGLEVGTNFTYVYSRVKMTDLEYESRLNNLRDGETISDMRQMFGQSPIIVNAYVNFRTKESGWNANLSYNVQSRRLAVVGINTAPDVYENPFHSLNFKTSKSFGENNPISLSFTMQNILGAVRHLEYESYEAENRTFSRINPGRQVGLGFSYRF